MNERPMQVAGYDHEHAKRLRWVAALLGEPESDCTVAQPIPVPDEKKCGFGQGAQCCAYLTLGSKGLEWRVRRAWRGGHPATHGQRPGVGVEAGSA